jgi:hypothetical protein
VRWQLQDVRVRPGALEQYAAEWRAAVAPARVEAGFSVVGPWLVPEESRFLWILGYDGDFAAADAAFDAPRRPELDPDRLVVETAVLFMEDPRAAAP